MQRHQPKLGTKKRKAASQKGPRDYIAQMKTKKHRTQPRRGPSLFLKKNGQWAAKINGRAWQFGPDEADARKRLAYDLPYLQAGQEVRHDADGSRLGHGCTLSEVVNSFLHMKAAHRDDGSISKRTFDSYLDIARILVQELGAMTSVEMLEPRNFSDLRQIFWARWPSPDRRRTAVTFTKTILRHAEPDRGGFIDRAIRFGQYFKPPTPGEFRRHRASKPAKMFQPDMIHDLLDAAAVAEGSSDALKAMILLGVNCGYDPSSCGNLTHEHLRQPGFVSQPLAKTGISRRCPLWPETQAALSAAIATSAAPSTPETEGLVLRTRRGTPWQRTSIGHAFKRLLEQSGHYVPGRAFLAMRHTFQTIGEEAPDRAARAAVAVIMGHVDQSMAGVYRELVTDDRLMAVTNHVRNWLYD